MKDRSSTIDNKFINTSLNEPAFEYNKSRYRLISLSFESTSFHFCSVDPRDSQFLEDGTTPASVSVYSASRYATRSCCIINSNLLTSFQPNESTHYIYIYPYHLYFLTKFTFLHRFDNWYIECCLPYHRYLSLLVYLLTTEPAIKLYAQNNFILFHSICRFMIIYHSIN